MRMALCLTALGLLLGAGISYGADIPRNRGSILPGDDFPNYPAPILIRVGQAGYKFLSYPVGARAAAMAGAFSTVAGDAHAVFWNPSCLAFMKAGRGEVFGGHTSWIGGITYEDAGMAYNVNGVHAFGFGLVTVDNGTIQGAKVSSGSPEGYELTDTFRLREYAFLAAYARRITDRFAIGGAFKDGAGLRGDGHRQGAGGAAVHTESARASGPFVAVDCTAIPRDLMESAFYGHEKGAFTDARESHRGYFEQADGGTLFLDEVGDMSPEMQARLLRTLQERLIRRVGGSAEIPVNVRVVSATNRDLPEAIAQGRFREDLYYRLNTFAISLPPLRERPEDIPPLADHFLRRFAREMQKPIAGFSPEAVAHLQRHSFPGNGRELGNLVERAAILCKADRITPDDLLFAPVSGRPGVSGQGSVSFDNPGDALRTVPEEGLNLSCIEAAAIREALRRCGDNRGEAARILGLSRFALRRRMAVYGIAETES